MNHLRSVAMALLAGGMAMGLACACRSNRTTDHEDVVLVRDGRPNATIVISGKPLWPKLPGDNELAKNQAIYNRPLAEDLQLLIEKATGAKLPIVTEDECPPTGNLILFGDSKLTREFGFDCRKMPPEGIRIVAFARGVALLGEVYPAAQRGGYFSCRMGGSGSAPAYPEPMPGPNDFMDRGIGPCTYIFLENFVGYRFYHPIKTAIENHFEMGTYIPQLATLAIPANTDFQDHPAFQLRSGLVSGWDGTYDPQARYRCMRPGASADLHLNHTHIHWHLKYGKSHPEIFAVDEQGRPYYQDETLHRGMRSALNYAHPKVLELEIEHIQHLDREGKAPLSGRLYATPNRIAVGPADGRWYDFSPDAQALSDPQADFYHSQTDLFWKYIEQLAVKAKELWPERRVIGAAYNRRLYPPSDRVKLPDNVDVQIALSRSSAMWPQDVYKEYIDQVMTGWWEAMGQDRHRVGVWDYFCWPHIFAHNAPIMNPHALQDFLKKYRDKFNGMFINPGGLEHLNHLMVALWPRLLWNPDLDVDAFIQEYCEKYYGPAGPLVEQIYQKTAHRYETVQWATQIRGGGSAIPAAAVYGRIYPPEFVAELRELFKKAFAAVADPASKLYQQRLEYIYNAGQSDGWERFFLTSDAYEASRRPLAINAQKTPGQPDWHSVPAYPLFRGGTIGNARPAEADEKTTLQVAADAENLLVRIECGIPQAAKNSREDLVTVVFYDVPGAQALQDEGGVDDGLMGREAEVVAKLSALPIVVGRDGKVNLKGVHATCQANQERWTADLSLPLALLGISHGDKKSVRLDVKRTIQLDTYKLVQDMKQYGDQKKKVHDQINLALCLKHGFVWEPFDYKRRAAQLSLAK